MAKASADPVAQLEVDLWLREAARFREAQQFGKAVELCRRVLRRHPTHPDALREMGLAALDTGAFDVAEGLILGALKAAPRSPTSLCALGQVYVATGRPQQAMAAYRKALALAPRDPRCYVLLGDVQLDLDDRVSARKSFRMALKLKPDYRLAAHMLAGLETGDPVAHRSYASMLFDTYAPMFEDHLVRSLGYDAPARLRAAVENAYPGRRFAAALDLGCGTGLVGEAFRDLSDSIDGIDIAPKMIEAAASKQLYRRLAVADIADFLASPEVDGVYDLILAADVFIYVGPLEDVFAAVRRAIAPGGIFAFSVEDLPEGDIAIRSSGRFAHSSAYVDRLIAAHGFAVRRDEAIELRKERGTAIGGRIVVLEAD